MGCPPGAQETGRVLARPGEAEASARQKVAPYLLWGLGRRVSMPAPSAGPALHCLSRKALEWGVAVRESARAGDLRGAACVIAPADCPTLGGHWLL